MTDELRRQLREFEQTLVMPEGMIAVRREYIWLLRRLGFLDKELVSLDALMTGLAPVIPPELSPREKTRPSDFGRPSLTPLSHSQSSLE